MNTLGGFSPIRHNPSADSKNKTDGTKSNKEPPRNDSFRKAMRDDRSKKDDPSVSSSEEPEEPASLFDLSKSAKNKKAPPKGSMDKDSSFSQASPLSRKGEKQESSDQSGEEASLAGMDEQQSESEKAALVPKKQTGEKPSKLEPALPEPKEPKVLDTNKSDKPAPMPSEPKEMKGAETNKSAPMPSEPKETKGAETKSPKAAAAQSQQLAGEINKQHQAAGTLSLERKGKLGGEKPLKTEEPEKGSTKQKIGKGEGVLGGKGEGVGAVSPSIQNVAFQAGKTAQVEEGAKSSTIKDIAMQIVDRIQVMRKDNETTTMITLRAPPILEGATITLATTDNAKREFNISFANLSPGAKDFLDRKLKEDSLTATLERRGITVHMVTTTTQSESLISAEAGQASKDRQDQQQEQQQKGQQQQKQQSSSEETSEEER